MPPLRSSVRPPAGAMWRKGAFHQMDSFALAERARKTPPTNVVSLVKANNVVTIMSWMSADTLQVLLEVPYIAVLSHILHSPMARQDCCHSTVECDSTVEKVAFRFQENSTMH
jgi:hypothetical protein